MPKNARPGVSPELRVSPLAPEGARLRHEETGPPQEPPPPLNGLVRGAEENTDDGPKKTLWRRTAAGPVQPLDLPALTERAVTRILQGLRKEVAPDYTKSYTHELNRFSAKIPR